MAYAPGELTQDDDTLLTAIAFSAGLDVVELSDQDLAYAPPFAPVWDPVLQAANKVRFRGLAAESA